jgi:glycosyltransferase involved in cell wall biosynthesis
MPTRTSLPRSARPITLTVGVPAHNESATIEALLHSLLRQRGTFTLAEVVVWSDGSTDGTERLVREFAKTHPIVRLASDGQQRGKYARVNQAFRACASEVLVMLDADIALVGEDFLETLTGKLVADPGAVMVAAHQVPLRPDGFVARVIHAHLAFWDDVRLSLPDLDQACNFLGAATAYRSDFFRSTIIPDTLTDPHLFLYLAARRMNGFRYCREAEVLYWPFSTTADLMKLLRRSIGTGDAELEKMFGADARSVYAIPRRYKLLGALRCFRRYPLYTPAALLLSVGVRFIPVRRRAQSPLWEATLSSKRPIPAELVKREESKISRLSA